MMAKNQQVSVRLSRRFCDRLDIAWQVKDMRLDKENRPTRTHVPAAKLNPTVSVPSPCVAAIVSLFPLQSKVPGTSGVPVLSASTAQTASQDPRTDKSAAPATLWEEGREDQPQATKWEPQLFVI